MILNTLMSNDLVNVHVNNEEHKRLNLWKFDVWLVYNVHLYKMVEMYN